MELLFEIVLVAFLGFFLTQMAALSDKTVAGDVLTAKGFPIIVAVLALIILAVEAVRYVQKCKKEGKAVFGDVRIPKQVLVVSGALLAYIVLLDRIGFIISTLIYTYANTRLLGYKNKKTVLLFAVIVTVCFTLVFGKLFFVPLPRGSGFLREWSYYIY